MASWKESVGRMAQNAMTKSKEMAETTRLNIEISNLEQHIREQCIQLGEYMLGHPELLPAGDGTVDGIRQTVAELEEKLAQNKQMVLDIRNVNICTGCGAEVSRSSKFCDRCGAPMERTVLEKVSQPPVCPKCGAAVDTDSAFCGECGTKLG